MGCHTWVYANRRPYDKQKVQEIAEANAKRLNAEYVMLTTFIDKCTYDNAYLSSVKSQLEFVLDLHNAAFTCKTSEHKIAIAKVADYFESFEDKELGKCLEYIFYNSGIYKRIDILSGKFIEKFKAFLSQCEPHNTAEDLFDGSVAESLGFSAMVQYAIDHENCTFALEVEYHDPFRFHDYDAPIFFSRDVLIAYIKQKPDMLYYYDAPNATEAERFKRLNAKLDEMYAKYPDLIIEFG
ncbi:hypothetical protein MA9V2_050 [Chryseobacterium phage MA9V-2]|nr:hypothetical protein MA9V2_050 [Chryseobacterium phage MA9V-2]